MIFVELSLVVLLLTGVFLLLAHAPSGALHLTRPRARRRYAESAEPRPAAERRLSA